MRHDPGGCRETVFPGFHANILNIAAQKTGLPRSYLVLDAPIVSLPGCTNVIYLPDDP